MTERKRHLLMPASTVTTMKAIAKTMTDNVCTRCGETLRRARIVMLEFNNCTNTWHKPGDVPEVDSLGVFPFGHDCAKKRIKGGD